MAFRRKRGDTHIGTIEARYGVDFGRRGDMRLDRLLNETGLESMTQLVAAARSGRLGAPESAERRACVRRGMEHVGGPGAPDCVGPTGIAEVKEQERPVDAYQVRQLARKPWAKGEDVELVSSSGFTAGARLAAKRHGIRLRRT